MSSEIYPDEYASDDFGEYDTEPMSEQDEMLEILAAMVEDGEMTEEEAIRAARAGIFEG